MGGSKTVVQAPPPAPAPDYSKISKDTLQAQIDLAPKLFAAEASPVYGQAAYANLQNQVNNILLSGQMGQLAQYYPQLANIETDYQTRLRQGELGQITSPELGLGAYQQAFNQLTPGYAEAVSGMGELARTATEQSVQRPTYTAYEQEVEGPSYGQYIGQIQGPSADLTLGGMQAYNFGGTQETPYQVGQNFLQAQPYQVGKDFLNQPAYQAGLYTGQVAGPQMQSKLGQIDTGLVNAYMNQLPGVAEGAQRLGEQVNLDLAAGRSLTPEQARLATQAAREAYAARGMALGPQAITSEVLNREELANQRYRERQAAAQQAMGTISNLYQPALAQTYARQAGAEQYELGAQGQQFGQAATREQQQAAIQGQQFGQALARGEAESGRLQAANTLQSNAAQIAASTLGTQQQALSPAMAAYFNVPPTQAAYGTAANQAQNQYAQAGLNIANPTNPAVTNLNMLPYQNVMSQYSNQVNLAASYLQGKAGGGGGGGMCCFIMLEARYGNGVMDEVVRRYRDEHVTPRNRRGYYKLAEVFVPLMRKSKLFKFAVSKLFADPLVSFAKWYYGQNKYGWVFKPVEGFWMNVFDLLGEDVPFIRENGEVV